MTPSNDHPEIPSLKPSGAKEEEKKGGGLAPSSPAAANKPAASGFKFPGFGGTGGSKAGSLPGLRVRGLSAGGSTVMDRLKNLRKKDLIFIAAGLCTLGMAPLAEHLLMSPDEQSGLLKEGFSTQGPLFADGSTVYEQGSGVGSPGGLVGQGSDIITPLNVRDPSNLVMSPGATKKADAVVAPPPASPSGKAEPDWKDVLKDSARSGAQKAAQQAPKLPRPNAKMAGAIRGLSALGGGGGGTSASLKLDALRAEHAPNRAAGSNALTRSQATPGFRGATSRSNSSTGAGEDLKAAGSRQADIFNRGGGAANALDSASREGIPTGGAGFGNGRPGNGDETKNPGGSSTKDGKQLGESLEFLRMKMEQDKRIDLKWKKKEWKEFGRQKMLEESAIKMGFDMFGKFAEKAVLDPLASMIGQAVAGQDAPKFVCTGKDIGTLPAMTDADLAKRGLTRKGSILYAGKDNQTIAGTCAPASSPDAGTGTDQNADPKNPDNIRGVPGSEEMRRRQQDAARASGDLASNKAQLADMQGRLRGICTQTPEAKQCALLSPLEKLTPIYGKLETASARLSDAWGHLGKAAENMDKEQKGLDASARHMKTGADKLGEAYAALRLDEKKSEPDTKTAQAAVAAAAGSLNSAAESHKNAQGFVKDVNTFMTASDQAARTGDGSAVKNIDGAVTDLGAVSLPTKITDQAQLGQWAGPYEASYKDAETAMAKAKDSIAAQNNSYQEWVGVYDAQGVKAREALHGSFTQSATPNVEVPPAAGAAARTDLGVMGQIHRNMVEHTVALTDANKKLMETAATQHYAASYKDPMENFDGSDFGIPADKGGTAFTGYPLKAEGGKFIEAKDAVKQTYVTAAKADYNGALETGKSAAVSGPQTDPVGQWVQLNQANAQGSQQGVGGARQAVDAVGAGLKGPAAPPAAPPTTGT